MAKANFHVTHCSVSIRIAGEKDGIVDEFGIQNFDLVNDQSLANRFKDMVNELGGIAHEQNAAQIAAWEELVESGQKRNSLANMPKANISRSASSIVEERRVTEEKEAARLQAEQDAEAARLARESAAEINTAEEPKKNK